MQRKSLLALAGVLVLVAGGAAVSLTPAGRAWADDRGWGRRGHHGMEGMGMMGGHGMLGMMGGPMMGLCPGSMPDRTEIENALKSDGVRWETVAAKRDGCFAGFDTDKDSTIGATEIDAAVTKRAEAVANRALAFADRNFDGNIERDEITGGWFGWRNWFGRNRANPAPEPASQQSTQPDAPGTPAPLADGTNDETMMPKRHRGHHGRHARFGKMFDRADTDKNGTVTGAELTTFTRLLVDDGKRLVLARLDKDKSGTLTRAEFDQPMRDMFGLFDINGDGRVTRDELPLPMQWRLEEQTP